MGRHAVDKVQQPTDIARRQVGMGLLGAVARGDEGLQIMAGKAIELDRRLLCQTPARQPASGMAIGGFGGGAFEFTLVRACKLVLERASEKLKAANRLGRKGLMSNELTAICH